MQPGIKTSEICSICLYNNLTIDYIHSLLISFYQWVLAEFPKIFLAHKVMDCKET